MVEQQPRPHPRDGPRRFVPARRGGDWLTWKASISARRKARGRTSGWAAAWGRATARPPARGTRARKRARAAGSPGLRGRPDAAVPAHCAPRIFELPFQERVPGRQRLGSQQVRRRRHRESAEPRGHGLARKKGVAVKILSSGELTKVVVEGARVSASARQKIVAVGGEVRRQAGCKGPRRNDGESACRYLPGQGAAGSDPLHDRHPRDLSPGDHPARPGGQHRGAEALLRGPGQLGSAGDRGLPGLLRRRRVQELLHLHAHHHALHLHVDHHAAGHHRVPEAEEDPGGGGRQEEDQPLDPLRHGGGRHHPVLHGHRVRQPDPRRHCHGASGLHPAGHAHHHHGNDVPDVARRPDHPARDRQRDLHDHLRGHRGAHPRRPLDPCQPPAARP